MSLPKQQILDTLRRVPLFNELSSAELSAIAARLSAHHYQAGQILFSEGNKGGDLLIVMEGSLRVLKMATNGRLQLIGIERPGASLGEVSVFDGGNYSATAMAATPVVLLRLRGEHFRNLCVEQPPVALKVIRVLAHRLRRMRQLVEELSFSTVRDRLIAHLLRLADERGAKGEVGIEISLDENNEELAARLGTVREIVSRNLGRLHGESLIVMRRRAFTIPDVDRLRAEITK